MIRLLSSVAVIALALTCAAPAIAQPGDIAGQTCISKTGAGGCAMLPAADTGMLETANGVVVAPDGADVYVGAGGGVAHFRRAADGLVTYANCVDVYSSGPSDRCPGYTAPSDSLGSLSANSISLAISPDGKDIYVTSFAKALDWWRRDTTTGNLTWGGCFDGASNSASNGHCGSATTGFAGGAFPLGAIDFPHSISVTPDGKSIYIADQTEGLIQAQRNTTTGAPTPTDCFNTTGSQASGCTGVAADIPMALESVDVAPNSRDIYVDSISPAGITHFSRVTSAMTVFTSCVASSSPSASCVTSAPLPVFATAGSLAIAGNNLVTEGGQYGPAPSGTLASFSRNSNGTLVFQGCASTVASPGSCSVLPSETVAGSIGRLLATPDGASIYLAPNGTDERALARFNSSLGFVSCVSDTGVAGCSTPPFPTPFAAPAAQMALSPDGHNIYEAASDTLNVFHLEQPGGSGAPGPGPGATSDKTPPVPTLAYKKKQRLKRLVITVKVNEAATVEAGGTVNVPGSSKTLKFKAVKRSVADGSSTKLSIKLSKANYGRASRALARHRKLTAKLTIKATDGANNIASAKASIKLKR